LAILRVGIFYWTQGVVGYCSQRPWRLSTWRRWFSDWHKVPVTLPQILLTWEVFMGLGVSVYDGSNQSPKDLFDFNERRTVNW